MQLTIDIKDSAIDKVMYLLENLKSDVKILKNTNSSYIDYVSDIEQRDLENILTSITDEDKKVSHSKVLKIDV